MVDSIGIAKRVFGAEYFDDDVETDSSKCISTRNRRLTCRACVEICPVSAISVSRGRLEVDHSNCTHCGACITVCPTQAFSSRWLPWVDLLSKCTSSLVETSGRPVIACVEGLSAADPEGVRDIAKVVEMPCLERVDEGLLLSLCATGAAEIHLVHGDCVSCETGCLGAAWTLVAEMSREMLGCVGYSVAIVDSDKLPEHAFDISSRRASGADMSRRDLFSSLRDDARQTAGQVVDEVMGSPEVMQVVSMLGLDLGGGSVLGEVSRGKICEWALGALAFRKGVVSDVANGSRAAAEESTASRTNSAGSTASVDSAAPKARASRSIAREVISSLCDVWMPTRVFGTPRIDPDLCSRCFLCTVYCTSHALSKLVTDHRVVGFAIKPWLCTQCGACVDMCKPDAIEVEPAVDLAALLEERETRSVC